MGRIAAMKKSCGDALASVRVFMKRSFAGMPNWLWAVVVTVVISIGIYTLVECPLWYWLRDGTVEESHGDTLRNLMLILAAVIGLPLAIWRSMTAHKQANVAQRGLQNERYQRGAEMLGSNTLSTRIGGIYALERLAREHPKECHIQIMDLLCTFVQYPKIRNNDVENRAQPQERTIRLAPDIQKALIVIGRRNQEQRNLEIEEEWNISLSKFHLEGANLAGAHLEGAFLIGTHLEGANLAGTHFEEAILIDAHLEDTFMLGTHLNNAKLMNAHLEGALLWNTHLEGANLEGANVEGVRLMNVEGLTQAMLDSAAHLDPDDKPLLGPDLTGACCAESGEPLVWRYPSDSSPTPSDDDKLNPSPT